MEDGVYGLRIVEKATVSKESSIAAGASGLDGVRQVPSSSMSATSDGSYLDESHSECSSNGEVPDPYPIDGVAPTK